VDVVRPAQQNDHRALGMADVDVADIQEAGIDLSMRAKGAARHGGGEVRRRFDRHLSALMFED
jgi:hypothetical protein